MVAFRIDPVLAQDLRPVGQQVGETRLQRPPGRYGDEAPAVAFDRTGCRERGVPLPDREPMHIAVSQRDLDKQVGTSILTALFENVDRGDGGARHGSVPWLRLHGVT